jgi:hypothetical protein
MQIRESGINNRHSTVLQLFLVREGNKGLREKLQVGFPNVLHSKEIHKIERDLE